MPEQRFEDIYPFPDLPSTTLREKVILAGARILWEGLRALWILFSAGLAMLVRVIATLLDAALDAFMGGELSKIAGMPGVTEDMKATIREITTPGRTKAGTRMMFAFAFLQAVFSGQLTTGPVRLWSMKWMRDFKPARASVAQTTQAAAEGWLDYRDMQEDMRDMGFSDERIQWLHNLFLQFPSPSQIQELINREVINEGTGEGYLHRQGYLQDVAKMIIGLRMEVPVIMDLIRFAVREAYTPSAIEELGLHQEFPEEIMPDATKRGLSRKYALDYWAAHWQLPSVSQVFEMFHRRVKDAKGKVFDRDAMARFLKYADYALPWRQMLIDIAYAPYTRRELPRLFRLGAIKDWEMKDAYLDLGLSPERAQVLVDASIREAREKERDLTRADIEAGYKRHLISPEAAAAALASLGYAEDEVAYILARDDYDKAQAKVSSRKATIKRRYISGLIDHELAIRQLSEAGVEAQEIPDLIAEWTEEREARVERPTVDQLGQMYRRRIISGSDLANELAGHGYNARYIKLMMDNIEAEIAEENARKSEAQKRREAVTMKLPTKADFLDWLQAGIITQDDLRQRMRDQHYLDEDIDRYLREAGIVVIVPTYRTEEGKVRVATLKAQVREGLISLGELVSGLLALEVPPSLADALAEYEEVKLGPAAA